jgi:hypothetical protein
MLVTLPVYLLRREKQYLFLRPYLGIVVPTFEYVRPQ